MTTLTPNRILQQGDEYRNNGTWKPVPKEDYGLQVMFTKYAEVRRPDEEPPKHNLQQGSETVTRHAHNVEKAGSTPAPAKISPDSEKPKAVKPSAIVTATAEKEKTPAPTPSGAGEPHPSSYLPTVISKKAHQDAIEHPEFVGHVPPEKRHKAAEEHSESAKVIAAMEAIIKINFPKPDPTDLIAMSTQPIWTGRNGTFTGYGLEAMTVNDNVMLSPIGKRGIGNGCIQFPRAVIPQLVDWLLRQQTTTPI